MRESIVPLHRRILTWIRWPVALGLVGWLLYSNWDAITQLMSGEIRWEFLGIAFVLCSSSIILTFYRWYLLVRALEFPFTFLDAIRLGFLGYLWNYVAPGVVGGDAAKAIVMAREQKSRRAVAVSTILLDRILGLMALLIVGSGAVFFVAQEIQHRNEVIAALWGGALAGLVGLLVMMTPALSRLSWVQALRSVPRLGGMFGDLLDAVTLYQSKRHIIIGTVLMSVVGHFGIISSFYFCAQAIALEGGVPGFPTHLLLIPLAEIVGVIVPLPGGIGALEGAVQKAYEMAGFQPGLGFLAAGAYRVTTVVIAAIGAGFYMTARRRIQSILAESDQSSDEADDEERPAESTGET